MHPSLHGQHPYPATSHRPLYGRLFSHWRRHDCAVFTYPDLLFARRGPGGIHDHRAITLRFNNGEHQQSARGNNRLLPDERTEKRRFRFHRRRVWFQRSGAKQRSGIYQPEALVRTRWRRKLGYRHYSTGDDGLKYHQ